MDNLLHELQKAYPELSFQASNTFFWSPQHRIVHYKDTPSSSDEAACWKLLHETAHGALDHKNYRTDFELLKLETEAWHTARILGQQFGITINENHVENCLDSYRDWLHARSTCPHCCMNGLMIGRGTYECINCSGQWRVSQSRFCRPYRLSLAKA